MSGLITGLFSELELESVANHIKYGGRLAVGPKRWDWLIAPDGSWAPEVVANYWFPMMDMEGCQDAIDDTVNGTVNAACTPWLDRWRRLCSLSGTDGASLWAGYVQNTPRRQIEQDFVFEHQRIQWDRQ